MRLRFGKFDPSFRNRSVADARWNCRDWRNADRQHIRLQNVIEQRRLAGANSAENSDFKGCRFHAIEQHAERAAKFYEAVRGDDSLNFAKQANLVTGPAQSLEPLLQIAAGAFAQIISQLGHRSIQLDADTVQPICGLRRKRTIGPHPFRRELVE